jgi:hypothetical protein
MPVTGRHGFLCVTVLALYLVSFVLPSYSDGFRSFAGGAAFFHAPFGALLVATPGQHIQADPGFALVLILAWLANPAFWIGSWFLVTRAWRRAAWAGTAALVLGSTMAVSTWASHRPGAHEQGPISVLLAGYYIWLLSMAALAASGWIGFFAPARLRGQDAAPRPETADGPASSK